MGGRAGRPAAYHPDNGEAALVMVTPELDKRGLRQHIQQLQLRFRRRFGEAFAGVDGRSPAESGSGAAG